MASDSFALFICLSCLISRLTDAQSTSTSQNEIDFDSMAMETTLLAADDVILYVDDSETNSNTNTNTKLEWGDALTNINLLWYFIGILIVSSLCFVTLCVYIHCKSKQLNTIQRTKLEHQIFESSITSKTRGSRNAMVPSRDTISSLISHGSVAPLEYNDNESMDAHTDCNQTNTLTSGRSFSDTASDDANSFINIGTKTKEEIFAGASNLYLYNSGMPIPEANEEGTVSVSRSMSMSRQSSIHSMSSMLSFIDKNGPSEIQLRASKNPSKSTDTCTSMTYMTASSVMSFNTCDNGSDESFSERMDEPHLLIQKYDDNVSIDDEKSFDSASISITHEEDEPICCNVTVTDGNPSWINKSKKKSHSTSDETSSWVSDHHDDVMRDAMMLNSCDSGTETQYDSTTSSMDSAIECQFQV